MPDPTPKAVSCTLHMRRVRSTLASTPSECRPPSRRHGRSAITAEQRRALFAIARRLGFDTDEMRVLTPTGSISALTPLQASDLIERFTNGGHGPCPEGTATARQLGFADHVRRNLGMGDADFRGWLLQMFHVPGLDDVTTSDLGRLLAALLRIQQRRTGIDPPKR